METISIKYLSLLRTDSQDMYGGHPNIKCNGTNKTILTEEVTITDSSRMEHPQATGVHLCNDPGSQQSWSKGLTTHKKILAPTSSHEAKW